MYAAAHASPAESANNETYNSPVKKITSQDTILFTPNTALTNSMVKFNLGQGQQSPVKGKQTQLF